MYLVEHSTIKINGEKNKARFAYVASDHYNVFLWEGYWRYMGTISLRHGGDYFLDNDMSGEELDYGHTKSDEIYALGRGTSYGATTAPNRPDAVRKLVKINELVYGI